MGRTVKEIGLHNYRMTQASPSLAAALKKETKLTYTFDNTSTRSPEDCWNN